MGSKIFENYKNMNLFFRLFIYQLKVPANPLSVGLSRNLLILLIDVTFSVSYKADSTVLGKSMRTTSIPFTTSNSNSNHRPYLPPMISHKSNTRKTTTNFNNFLLTLSNLFDQFTWVPRFSRILCVTSKSNRQNFYFT